MFLRGSNEEKSIDDGLADELQRYECRDDGS